MAKYLNFASINFRANDAVKSLNSRKFLSAEVFAPNVVGFNVSAGRLLSIGAE